MRPLDSVFLVENRKFISGGRSRAPSSASGRKICRLAQAKTILPLLFLVSVEFSNLLADFATESVRQGEGP